MLEGVLQNAVILSWGFIIIYLQPRNKNQLDHGFFTINTCHSLSIKFSYVFIIYRLASYFTVFICKHNV
jgi:hypothetical protein